MATFEKAFQETMDNEGGFILHKNSGESTNTYAGIYRKAHPTWKGWSYFDKGEVPPTELVRKFYKGKFWDRIKGDEIKNQVVAENIYDFYVNVGTPAIKLAQKTSGAVPDGQFGIKTLKSINDMGEDFVIPYVFGRISYYGALISKKHKYAVFAKGWIDRAIRSAV